MYLANWKGLGKRMCSWSRGNVLSFFCKSTELSRENNVMVSRCYNRELNLGRAELKP